MTPRELIVQHGDEHNTRISENIAAGQESAAATFVQWRESESHRELMVDEGFEAVGIARANNVESEYDWYWTAQFGGVLAEPALGCDEPMPGTPAGTPGPEDAVPVRLICDGLRLADGTYDLTCREAATSRGALTPL